jgi:hypothetical protein
LDIDEYFTQRRLNNYDNRVFHSNKYVRRRADELSRAIKRTIDLTKRLPIAVQEVVDNNIDERELLKELENLMKSLDEFLGWSAEANCDKGRTNNNANREQGLRAVEAAAYLLTKYSQKKLVTTKTGDLCRLAQLFYGDGTQKVDLQYHARKLVLQSKKAREG